ncbi:hypothetical protein Tco_1133535 [Tanacetum coccineum]
MDNPDITMEEYIRLEEEKAHRHGKVYNWETAKYDETSLSEYDEVEQNVLYLNDLFPFNIIYPDNLKSDKDNDDNEIDIIQFSGDNVNTQGSKKFLEASHDKIDKIFIMKSFVMELDVNIMAWNYLNNGMLLNLIKNLYVPFGIPFDPKRYYKDGVYTRMLRRPRSPYGVSISEYAVSALRTERLNFVIRVEGYTEEIVHNFEDRLETIFERQVNRVHVLDFEGLTPEMRQDLAERLRMVYTGDDGQEIFVSLHTSKEMAEDGFEAYWLGSKRVIPDKGDLNLLRRLCYRLISYNISGRGQAPEKVTATDLFYLRIMDRGTANFMYLLAQYLFMHAKGRKSCARLSGGHFIGCLAHHRGLVSDDGLRGLSIVTYELPLIDMGKIVKLNICMEVGDDWAWVVQGVERHPVAAAAALGGAKDAPDVNKGA